MMLETSICWFIWPNAIIETLWLSKILHPVSQ